MQKIWSHLGPPLKKTHASLIFDVLGAQSERMREGMVDSQLWITAVQDNEKKRKQQRGEKSMLGKFCRSSVERGVEYESKFKFWDGDKENDNTWCFQVSKWRSCSKHISEIVVCGPSLNHCMLKPRNTVIGPSDLAVFSRQSSVLSYSTPRPLLIVLALAVLFMHWIFSLSLCGAWKPRSVACTTSDVRRKIASNQTSWFSQASQDQSAASWCDSSQGPQG